MTDQTPFERELADRMRSRADRTRVDLDHERIVGARRPSRTLARPTWALAATFAAVIALVVTGLVLLVRTADEPTPADTFPPAPTVPPPPDYGVLDDTPGPTLEDHWHIAYGFFLCGQWFQLRGNLEEQDATGNFTNERFLSNGLHSHEDGVIHVHPYGEGGLGDNTTFGLFLSNYGVELRDDAFVAPPGQLEDVPCDVSVGDLVVAVWPSVTSTERPLIVTAGRADVPLRDGTVIVLTDAADEVSQPPWAADLPVLAGVDSAQLAPEDLPAPPTSLVEFGDIVPCGLPLPAPSNIELGIEAGEVVVLQDGASAVVTVRNTTTEPISVGVAPFLLALDSAGAVASRPLGEGGWLYVDVAAGEALPVPIDAPSAVGTVVGTVPCSGDPGGLSDAATPSGAFEFVAVLDVGGEIVASDPITLAVTDGGAVVSSSVPTPTP